MVAARNPVCELRFWRSGKLLWVKAKKKCMAILSLVVSGALLCACAAPRGRTRIKCHRNLHIFGCRLPFLVDWALCCCKSLRFLSAGPYWACGHPCGCFNDSLCSYFVQRLPMLIPGQWLGKRASLALSVQRTTFCDSRCHFFWLRAIHA